MHCNLCGEWYLISQSALCSSHKLGAFTEYDYGEKKRSYTCCQLLINFSKQAGVGCVNKFHEPKNPPEILKHLIPKRYKLIKEESLANLDDFENCDFINPESVNGMVGLNTYKN